MNGMLTPSHTFEVIVSTDRLILAFFVSIIGRSVHLNLACVGELDELTSLRLASSEIT